MLAGALHVRQVQSAQVVEGTDDAEEQAEVGALSVGVPLDEGAIGALHDTVGKAAFADRLPGQQRPPPPDCEGVPGLLDEGEGPFPSCAGLGHGGSLTVC